MSDTLVLGIATLVFAFLGSVFAGCVTLLTVHMKNRADEREKQRIEREVQRDWERRQHEREVADRVEKVAKDLITSKEEVSNLAHEQLGVTKVIHTLVNNDMRVRIEAERIAWEEAYK